jgi:hypothetical protein
MRRIFAVLALIFAAPPALAQTPNHDWVKSGTDPTYGMDECMDQNSITMSADGYAQFGMLLGCAGPDNQIFVGYVNCNEDMTGANLVMKSYPYNKNGTYNWPARAAVNRISASLFGRSAKFVCAKRR